MHVHSEHVNTVTSFPLRYHQNDYLDKINTISIFVWTYPHSIGYSRCRKAGTNRSDIQYLICVGYETWNEKDGNNDRNVE